MIQNIKNSKKAAAVERIYMPGEIEYEKNVQLLKNGIKLNEKTVKQLNELAKKVGATDFI